MKILHIGKFFHPYQGGMENFLTDLALEQASVGLDTSVIVHHHKRFELTSHERIENVAITRTLTLGQMVYAPLAPSFGYHLAKAITVKQPDIIHAHLPNLSAFWLLSIDRKIPLLLQWQSDVVQSKVDERLSFLYPLYRVFEKKLLERAQAIIVSSENYLRGSDVLQPFNAKISTIPLGIDLNRLYRPTQEEMADIRGRFGRFLVLSVGRFTYYKGFEYLIDAAKDIPDASFIIIGDGPLRSKLTRRISQAGLQNRFFLPGSLSDRELHTTLASCDVFCLPSIERTEAFGIVLLEAMAFGKPLITTDIDGSGVNWVNLAEETGLVVRNADAAALAEGINSLLNEKEMRIEMGHRARERLDRLFLIQPVSEKIRNLYSTIQTPPTLGS